MSRGLNEKFSRFANILVDGLRKPIYNIFRKEGTMVLFERIRELRESTGMSARKFAEELGIKYTTYYGYETGTREPGSEFVANFTKRFGVTTDYILGLEEKNPEKNPSDAIKEATEGMTTEDILLKFARSAGLLNDNQDLSDDDFEMLKNVISILEVWFRQKKEESS